MKVVATSNHGLDSVANILVKDGLTEEEAKKLADELNKDKADHSEYWNIVVADDYVLWRGMADLVGDIGEDGKLI